MPARIRGRELRAWGRERHVQAVIGLTALAAVVRFTTIELQSFSFDEAITAVRVLQPGFADLLEAIAKRERTGPLYYLLAWVWSKPFGLGELGLRSLPAALGTLAVPVAYLAASELASRRAGVIAAALVALNPYLAWYSQEARSYSLFVLLTGLTLLFLARSVERPTRRNLMLWAAASAAALATHYFAVFILVPQALWLLYVLRDRSAVAAVAGPAAAGLLLVPLALYQGGSRHAERWTEVPLLDRAADTGVKFLLGEEAGASTPLLGLERGGLTLAAAAALLGALGLVLLMRHGGPRERRGGLLAAALGGVGLVLPVLMALGGVDLLNPRYQVATVLLLLVAVGAGFAVRRSRLGAVAAAAMSAAFIGGLVAVAATPELQRYDRRTFAESIGPTDARRLIIAPLHTEDTSLYYLEGDVEILSGRRDERVESHVEDDVPHAGDGAAFLQEVVVVAYPSSRPSAPAPGFELVESEPAATFDVRYYRSDLPRRVELSELDVDRLVGRRSVVLAQAGEAGA